MKINNKKILIENSIVKNDAIRVNTLKGTKEDVIKYFEENNIPYSVNYDTNNGIIIYESIIKTDLFKKGKHGYSLGKCYDFGQLRWESQ